MLIILGPFKIGELFNNYHPTDFDIKVQTTHPETPKITTKKNYIPVVYYGIFPGISSLIAEGLLLDKFSLYSYFPNVNQPIIKPLH